MTQPFIGEVRIFGCNFAPRGWAMCNGQILSIAQNTALFSLLGTTYGGNGQTTFALPDLQGRAPLHYGSGPGLTSRSLGEIGGSASVSLLLTEVPAHSHALGATTSPANRTSPVGNSLGRATGATPYVPAGGATAQLAPETVVPAGSGLPHNNLQPYLAVTFCIALEGIFPPR